MKTRVLAVFLIAMLLGAQSAVATTIIPMSVEKLTQRSTAVLKVKAVGSQAKWTADRKRIYTYTTFVVQEAWKQAGGAQRTVVVKQFGGELDGLVQSASGVRRFRSGEEAVLFLRPSPDGEGVMVVTGFIQGDFRITGDRVSNAASDVQAFDKGSRKLVSYTGESLDLRSLEARVRKAATL